MLQSEMNYSARSGVGRVAYAIVSVVITMLTAVSCGEQTGISSLIPDEFSPALSIAASSDTVLINTSMVLTLNASDNLSLKTVTVSVGASTPFVFDTTITFTSNRPQFTAIFNILVEIGAGGDLPISATVEDGAGNISTQSTSVFVFDPDGLLLTILVPPDSSVVAPGKSMLITVQGQAAAGVLKLGYQTTGVFTSADTITTFAITNPQVEDTSVTFTITIPAGTPLGFFEIDPFGRDSLGRAGSGNFITIEVIASTGINDTIPPVVTDSLAVRSERTDSIRVTATDIGGIALVGFLARDLQTGATIGGDSLAFNGNSTVVSVLLGLGLDTLSIGTQARLVEISPFAVDSVGNRGGLSLSGNPVFFAVGAKDTITIVEGLTLPLPAGGRVADAIYNRNLNEVYFTNVELDRLEIFEVATASFDPDGIAVGSQPWGIAMWPSDTLGGFINTVLVANSGGTNISIVDVAARTQLRRHPLPNFLVEQVDIFLDETGTFNLDVISHDFSDRPQFLASVCRVTTGTATCHADSVYAVYSTTPTIDQGLLFPSRGTIRWEKVSSPSAATGTPESHFFYEHVEGTAGLLLDTLQLIADRGATQTVILSAACGVLVDFLRIAFLDTTYVRSSGNFTHVLFGEGGIGEPSQSFARGLRYDATSDIVTGTCADTIFGVPLIGGFQKDFGVSPSIKVSDFISNTATRIRSVAVNFSGLTNLIRAGDSIYVLDENLRLTGLIGGSGTNAGMDLNFDHAFDANDRGTGSDDRVVFAARDDPNIDVFDTFFFGRIATVPIKNPVTGPLRVARLPSGEQLLVAVTDFGIVTVTLPAITNPNPSSWWGTVPGR